MFCRAQFYQGTADWNFPARYKIRYRIRYRIRKSRADALLFGFLFSVLFYSVMTLTCAGLIMSPAVCS